jgi:formylmethanofuran--tetrahydromethanopterin N-formyltransferase
VKGVGGGNFLILARNADAALASAEAAVDALAAHPGIILPFPGGVVRSGSKVGARRIKTMIASTNDAFCPTLRAVTQSALPRR